MKTYSFLKEGGLVFAFEIENIYISIKSIALLLKSVRGVSNIRQRKLFGDHPDIHFEFTYLGKEFIVWELYGDNSRYWIGPENVEAEEIINVKELEEVFRQYHPTFIRKVIGDLLTLKFLSVFKKYNLH